MKLCTSPRRRPRTGLGTSPHRRRPPRCALAARRCHRQLPPGAAGPVRRPAQEGRGPGGPRPPLRDGPRLRGGGHRRARARRPAENRAGREVRGKHQGPDSGRRTHRPADRSLQRLLAAQAVPKWQAILDAFQELDCVGAGGPVGFWGVSLNSAIGVPFAAAESRITAAAVEAAPPLHLQLKQRTGARHRHVVRDGSAWVEHDPVSAARQPGTDP